MKPKTKLQKIIHDLSASLPAITDEQKRHAFDNVFDLYFVRSRNTLYCLECGHSWKNTSIVVTALAGAICPACSADLKSLDMKYKAKAVINDYYGIVTVTGGYQVVRMFYVSKCMKKHTRSEHLITEVMQHWIDEKGKATLISRSVNGLSGYWDQWNMSSGLEVRPRTNSVNGSYGAHARYGLAPFKIWPKIKVLPILRRNGFKKGFHGMAPHRIFIALLTNPKAETLWKAGQISLFNFALGGGDVDSRWSSIKICMRNGYIVKDASMWRDYLEFLKRFGRDLNNPHYVCPANLKAAHDHYTGKVREIRRREQNEREREKLIKNHEKAQREEATYQAEKQRFFDLRFKAGDIDIVPLKSVAEVVDEGDKLKHCVFASEYHLKPDSLLLSARRQGQPIETIEVSLKQFDVVQARGFQNQATEHNELIVRTVRKNMKKIAKRASNNVTA